jgi:hypothetical protein
MKREELRSLERERMYSIFAPLDPEERLPREMLQDRPTGGALFLGLVGRRYGPLGRRELAGILWLPALATVITLGAALRVNGIVVLGLVALMLAGFVAFAISGEPDRRLK